MKRKGKLNRRKRNRYRLRLRKKNENLFVKRFIKQPGKTRSGTVYTKKVRGKSTHDIFGSLLGACEGDDKVGSCTRPLSKTENQCCCRLCLREENRDKENTCTSSSSGVGILLRNEELNPRAGVNTTEVRPQCSHDKRQCVRNYYCNCSDCIEARKRRIYELQKRRYPHNQAPTHNMHISHHDKRSRHRQPHRKIHAVHRSDSAYMWTTPKRIRKTRRSKSLLKYVLNKRSHEAEQNCSCCKLCMEKLFQYIKEEIAKQKYKSYQGQKCPRSKDSAWYWGSSSKRRGHGTRRYKSDTSVPRVSTGTARRNILSKNSTRQVRLNSRRKLSEEPPHASKLDRKNRLSQGDNYSVNYKSGTRARKTKHWHVTKNKKLMKSVCLKRQNRKSSKRKKKRGRPIPSLGHLQGQRNNTRFRKRTLHPRWKVLSGSFVRKLKKQIRKRLVKSDVKKNASPIKKANRTSFNIVPMPRTGPKECNEKAWKKQKNTKSKGEKTMPTEEQIRQCIADKAEELECSDIEDNNNFAGAPTPSARVPTYIAMVKTAIRDLKPFALTTKQAISKYIQIRYSMKNDCLLCYVLRWMVDMGVLQKKCGLYSFCGKRLVKKKTVAVLGNRLCCLEQMKCPMEEMKCCPKRRKKRKSQKKCPREEICEELEDMCCNAPICKKKRKRQKPRCVPCCPRECPSPKEQKCCKTKCTCARELRACKNRVKVRTRYVRNNGKIYKQEEFI